MSHRWSGWPGAWCLDCGEFDPMEECVATCDWDEDRIQCDKHPMTECKMPGARLFDPYSGA